ncbi:hypothetical protein [Vibrio campbellii]|uniref:hypothetical protein n=1 Tax=Vibrio campbellii TaxID=680 RepID=UPI001F46D20A|nr:hypothetical protein [Vibrio campbellii]MCE7728140.1 hypothetical protein [Vibrio campbellii]
MNKLYKLYNSTFSSPFFESKSLIAKLFRLILSLTANLIAPILYDFKLRSYRGFESTNIAVNLTSFPNRISRLHLVIKSILLQEVVPETINVWLSKEQFEGGYDELPLSLKKLNRYGVNFYFVDEDLRSYKKFYYFLSQEKNQTFITLDDDVFYHKATIKMLLKCHYKYPNKVCANRVLVIDQHSKYSEWIMANDRETSSFLYLPTGCAGVLYPNGCLGNDALNKSIFTRYCSNADDIWLNVNTFLNGYEVCYTGFNLFLLNVYNKVPLNLHDSNVGEGNNDKVIKSMREYFQSHLGLDVFDRKN